MLVKVAMPNNFQLRVIPTFKSWFLEKQGDIHYIGGAEVLPPPLEPDEEAAVIAELGTENEQQARSVLIEHNLRLVVYIAKKFDNTGVGVEDLISIGTIGLIKAINTYNPVKNIKLATYASRCIENEILMYIRNTKKHKEVTSLYSSIGEDKDGNEIKLYDIIEDNAPTITSTLIAEEQKIKLREALKILDERELDIISRRFGFNNHKIETQKQIAKQMGISRSYVSRIEKRALTKLYMEIKNINN